MSSRDHRRADSSFDVQLARAEARLHETEKTRVVPKFEMPDDAIPGFTDETPTRPGKESVPEKSGAVRRSSLPAIEVIETIETIEVEEAAMRPTIDITPVLLPPVVRPEPMPTPMPPIVVRRANGRRVLLAIAAFAALVVAVFALRWGIGRIRTFR